MCESHFLVIERNTTGRI